MAMTVFVLMFTGNVYVCDDCLYLATLVCITEQLSNDYVSVLTHRHVLVSWHIMVYIYILVIHRTLLSMITTGCPMQPSDYSMC